VVFNEDVEWDFRGAQKHDQFLVLEDVTNSSPSNSASSYPADSSSSSPISSSSSPSNETSPRKFRSLREIYASGSFALCVSNLVYYEEITQVDEWRNAMNEEMVAIQKN